MSEYIQRHWNYRVIEFVDPKTGDAWRSIHEVHYENLRPISYSEQPASVVWDTSEGNAVAADILGRMSYALDKEILVERDFSPVDPNEVG